MVRLIQANLRRSSLAVDCLVKDMVTWKTPTIALIQEPYLGSRKSEEPRGFPQIFNCQAVGNNPRAAIVSLGCETLPCPDYTGRDVTTCQVTLAKGGEAFLVSVYCDIKIMSVPEEVRNLFRDMPGANIVLCLDSNAHSKSWGCPDTNPRGEIMEEFIVNHDLTLVNSGNADTFDSSRSSTIIDITLCTKTNGLKAVGLDGT